MALIEFTQLNKLGLHRTRVFYQPTTSYGFNPKNYGNHIQVRVFKYDYKHPIIPPILYLDSKGDKYLNNGTKVLPETTLEDVNWIKPKLKTEIKTTFEFKSKSSNDVYTVTKSEIGDKITLRCDCRGFFMAKDRKLGCKHVQEVRNK